jgi:O-antigen/teichoic acid export membrane protein
MSWFAQSVVAKAARATEAIGPSRYRQMLKSDFVSKVAQTYATQILKILIGILTTVVVARILGPEGRGLFAVAGAVVALGVQFGNLGLHASNTYFVARDPRSLPALVGNSLVVSFAFGGFMALALWFVFQAFPGAVSIQGSLLVLALISIPFGLAFLLLENLLLGLHEVRTFNAVELVNRGVPTVLLLLVIPFCSIGPAVVLATTLVAVILGGAGACVRIWSRMECLPEISLRLFRANLDYGLKAYATLFFCFLVLRSDLFLVQKFIGAEQAGYYSIAATMADMVALLAATIGTILFPKLSAEPMIRRKFEIMYKASVGTAIIMAPLVVTASLLARPVVHLMFGAAFLPSVTAFVLLMPGIFFLSIHSVSIQFLNSIGYPKVIVAVWALAAVLNIAVNFWAIPRWGISGASVVSSGSYSLAAFLIFAVIWQYKVSLTKEAKQQSCPGSNGN